jgi:hypothetical protein
MAMCAYDEARGKGDKHSAAVQYAVDFVKERNRGIPISMTEVKRLLATWRPRGSQTVLLFEKTILSEEDKETHRWLRQQVLGLEGKKGVKAELPPDPDRAKVTAFRIRLGERPNYSRHNRKNAKD